MSHDDIARARTPGKDRSMSCDPDAPCGLLGLTYPATSDSLLKLGVRFGSLNGHNYPYLLPGREIGALIP